MAPILWYRIYQYMRLTNHTDYGLRLLMMSAMHDGVISVSDAADRLAVSKNHLMKVAQSLTRAGYLKPIRGRSGGFVLARSSREVSIGNVVRALESDRGMVACMRGVHEPCPLEPSCRLPELLTRAEDAFFQELDGCSLHDLVTENQGLLQVAVGAR